MNKRLAQLMRGMVLFSVLLAAPALADTAQYTYDSLNRLIKVQYDNGTTVEYTYDTAGNRLTRQVLAFGMGEPLAAPPMNPGRTLTLPPAIIQVGPGQSTEKSPLIGGILVAPDTDRVKVRPQVSPGRADRDSGAEDKDYYQEQISRGLEESEPLIREKAQEVGAPPPLFPSTSEENARTPQTDLGRKDTNRIRQDKGKIYNFPSASRAEGDKTHQ
jgi:YD repeat-containing protein